MTYEQMKNMLDNYNWDDGFKLPKRIISDANCDLAMALEIFYLADGYGYFQTFSHNTGGTKVWFCFIGKLCYDIENGKYIKSEHHYTIPLSKVQRYQLRKKNIPEVYLADV
ncbi:DUF4274 domain-containing protein [Anaerocolumna sp. AGMB13025]|uniref:DUF4274 domain-containing protein n=1 Tax=Anaerocolumna sp. AGMB13025 TaxID=3039116 RepID=UPI00241E5BEB|nr:DUF4274 domain-containing protein [Anaerocolumna sp. AGMB13025]WFR59315.1 DUF4274 domain-containing protein [Anaerocolumna sp. AGMB13025]